jgi:hypothetical protein
LFGLRRHSRPPKHEEYERLAFGNATLAGLLQKTVFFEMQISPYFIGLN